MDVNIGIDAPIVVAVVAFFTVDLCVQFVMK